MPRSLMSQKSSLQRWIQSSVLLDEMHSSVYVSDADCMIE
jgi:hypothetical protein